MSGSAEIMKRCIEGGDDRFKVKVIRKMVGETEKGVEKWKKIVEGREGGVKSYLVKIVERWR